MVVSTAILLIVGGVCAAAPLFKRVSKGLEKLLVIVGLAVAAYLHTAFSVSSTTILSVVFIITILIVYTLLRFVEDILEFIGTVLAFPPVAIAVGLVSVYFGIITYGS